LVASRSGELASPATDKVGPRGPTKLERVVRAVRPGGDDGAEVSVHLKVGYRTVLLVAVVFDLISTSSRELVVPLLEKIGL